MARKFDLNEWLIEFVAKIIDVSEALPKTFAGNHIAGQLVRSGIFRHYIVVKRKVQSQEMILFIK